ncbi:hypothetical protein F5Y19DRAFT_132148 [Xylariaceae sp. FL1651]|nr:hypothetical protein F5Y19DRAFT_132148 [Xylariaceae sp. FL1651]
MARLTQGPITQRRGVSNPDSLTDLTRLLGRLQQNILHADAERERRLRTSEYERNKAGIVSAHKELDATILVVSSNSAPLQQNLEYARTLLTKLEQDALAVKVHSKRQEMQTDLNQKREILEQLTERLRELEDISIDSDEDDDSDEGEDLLGGIIPTPSQSSGSRSGEHHHDEIGDIQEEEDGEDGEDEGESTVLPEQGRTRLSPSSTEPPPRQTPTIEASSTQPRPPEPQNTGTTTTSSLRPRGGAAGTTTTSTQPPSAPDTAVSTSALRSQLFRSHAADPTTSVSTTTATAEAILDHHRAEQDKLTESMVSMARALKESTHAFSSALREDQDVLASAGKGLDRSERGLEGVSGRMGNLRRLTEGKGWWGRMLLYVWIAGLAVFALLLVFVFPKLRF